MHFKRFVIPSVFVRLAIVRKMSSLGCAKSSLDVVSLDSGKIRGTIVDGVWTYLGIPYAAPPLGDLRWKEPQPDKSWDGIRDANKFAAACPQPKTSSSDIVEMNEDCLYLNIWSPAKSPADKLPVMVWIHGGGFVAGSGSEHCYDGMNLARQDVIVITLNYRLGPLGFLSHPLLSKESTHGTSGNYGLLDQVAALKWVQRNIEAFGGDPKNVTIAGQSSGSQCVINLMISPLAGGLFQRAIAESSSFKKVIQLEQDDTMARAEKTGEALAASLGCDNVSDQIRCLRRKSAEDVVKAAFSLPGNGLGDSAIGSGMYDPVVDGWAIPSSPRSLFTMGKQQKVPLLIGTNEDEGTIFVIDNKAIQSMSANTYGTLVKVLFKDNADTVLAKFYPEENNSVVTMCARVLTFDYRAGAWHAADTTAAIGAPVYMYHFTHVADTALKKYGACHGSELPYVFGNFAGDQVSIPDTTAEVQLSQNIIKYWTNFVKTGNPNGQGLHRWPAFSTATGDYIEFGDQPTAKTGLMQEYWDIMNKLEK